MEINSLLGLAIILLLSFVIFQLGKILEYLSSYYPNKDSHVYFEDRRKNE